MNSHKKPKSAPNQMMSKKKSKGPRMMMTKPATDEKKRRPRMMMTRSRMHSSDRDEEHAAMETIETGKKHQQKRKVRCTYEHPEHC